MSVPLSLRLCCLAAMAPALTESTSQSGLQLPDSPPPVVSGIPTTNGKRKLKTSRSLPGIVTNQTVTGELQPSRRLFMPIQGNGIDLAHKLTDNKVILNLQELGLPVNFPNILKQLSETKLPEADLCPSHNHTLQDSSKKMNQPSNGNGPNGTGRRFMKQTSLIDEKTLNGHTNNHTTKQMPVQCSKTLLDSVNHVEQTKIVKQTSRSNSVPSDMCHSSEYKSNLLVKSDSALSSKNPVNKMCYPENQSALSVPDKRASIEMQESEPRTSDLVNDASRKQHLLERRSQFLVRRLRRLQGRQLDSHVKSQLKAFVDYQHQNLQSVASKAIRPFSDLPNTVFNCSDVKNLSTSNLVTLVRKLQAAQPKHVLEAKKPNNKKGVMVMEQTVSAESERKAGNLRTNVRHWNDVVDSDATESSSGGESCEEWEDCPLMFDNKVPTPLYKRAEWKWSTDRAAIVARWTWLQAQVSDLEYRIRQQSEIYKTIRSSKGTVTLSDPIVLSSIGPGGDAGTKKVQESPANVASLMINVNKQASKLSQSLGNCLSPNSPHTSISDKAKGGPKSVNGFIDRVSTPSSGNTPTSVDHNGDSCSSVNVSPDLNSQAPLDSSCVAARCRPVRFYRKRKLLRTEGLHSVSHKAARLSSVRCQCYPPVMSCPMCGGRYNNVQQLDAEGMPIMEKVSLLDPSFHPVLSFPQEIGLPLHFEALLKSGEWQSLKCQPRNTLRTITSEKKRQKLLNAQIKDQVRKKKYNKAPAAVLLSSAKLRSKYDGKSPNKAGKKVIGDSRSRRKDFKRRRAMQLAAMKKSFAEGDLDGSGMYSSGGTPSPQYRDGQLSHSASSMSLKDMKEARKKRFENAYDINNIVIPYSMAASTRVEKPQYKEIQTPKWRCVNENEEPEAATPENQSEQNDSEVEDLSDEAFLARHEASEMDERKRFRNFITYPPARRSRLSRESESNTHDTAGEISLHDSGSTCDLQASFQSGMGRDDQRRRSGSVSANMSRRGSFLEEYMGHFGRESFDREHLDPFLPRQFPLSDELFEEMKKEQLTVGVTRNTYPRMRTLKVQDDPSIEFVSSEFDIEEVSESPYVEEDSPIAEGFSLGTGEDENDPEWNESQGDRRSSISMRHSKR